MSITFSKISPCWCSLCKDNETQSHLFIFCPYSTCFWNHILHAFNWFVVFPSDITGSLSLVIEGHPFKGRKSLLWMQLIRAFLWSIWVECNSHIFNDKAQHSDRFLDHVIFIAISWCKLSKLFHLYSFDSLLTNWRCIL